MFKKIMASLLAATIIFTATASIKSEAKEISVLDFVDISDGWSTEALVFAVNNGILKGENKKISPKDKLTKAQVGAIISRMFASNGEAELSKFKDLDKGAWYYDYISKAVHMDIFNTNVKNFEANKDMTREEAFSAIARAFKVKELNSVEFPEGIDDLDKISDWAKEDLYALINAGYIEGFKGEINPQGTITREEFAQSIYNIVREIINTPGARSNLEVDSIAINKPGVIIRNSVVNGDVIIGEGAENGDVILDNVKVKGDIIVRGGSLKLKNKTSASRILLDNTDGKFDLYLGDVAKADELIINKSGDVTGEGKVAKVLLSKSASDVNIGLPKVEVEIAKGASGIKDKDGKIVSIGKSLINDN